MIISFDNQLTACSWYISVWYRSLPPPQKKNKTFPMFTTKKNYRWIIHPSILSITSMIGLSMKDRRLDLGALQGSCVLHRFEQASNSYGFPEIPRWKSSYFQIVDECLLGGDMRGHSPMDVVLPEVIWFKDRWIVATLHGLSQEVFSCFLIYI